MISISRPKVLLERAFGKLIYTWGVFGSATVLQVMKNSQKLNTEMVTRQTHELPGCDGYVYSKGRTIK